MHNNKSILPSSPFKNKPYGGISSDTLRFFAMIFMLLDHLWASVIPGNRWMTDVGRLAFPIFAFMISEGYVHTSNPKNYLKRLFIFGLISEIPFNLFYSGYWIDPFNRNVLFTFVWGLLAIIQIDKIKQIISVTDSKKFAVALKPIVKALLLICLISLGAKFSFADYKFLGYLTVVMFYVFRSFSFGWMFQLIGMVLLNWTWFKGEILLIELFGIVLEIPNQAYRIFALIPIWLYNGKKRQPATGTGRYGFYLFYPAHMLVLYFIQQIVSYL